MKFAVREAKSMLLGPRMGIFFGGVYIVTLILSLHFIFYIKFVVKEHRKDANFQMNYKRASSWKIPLAFPILSELLKINRVFNFLVNLQK